MAAKKLTWEDVSVIRSQQHRQRYYADRFGVSVSTISRVQLHRSWTKQPATNSDSLEWDWDDEDEIEIEDEDD
jgi:hypothetical protein